MSMNNAHEELPISVRQEGTQRHDHVERQALVTRLLAVVQEFARNQIKGLQITLSDCGKFATLHGNAPSYYIKQMAQTAAMRHDTSLQIVNQIAVAA